MAHGLPRSDHRAGQRDSPAANGALLALTGLMLEQESELSAAVGGRAVGQQDQGEQSPMSAAEMEQRIGLMGRLNDAAARLRPQPEPEVADNDADLWYAACFACTTSLQVVRLVRRQRAELPQRDLVGEAYLVVLAQLAMEAEESRERLEETAIPNIDDGLTDARATLLAAVAGDEPDVSEHLLRDSDFDTEFATLRQARAIITTARRQGLDSVKLAKLAAAMGHEAEELGVTPPSTNYATVNILLGEARVAGLPHEAIDRIYQAIDPDGYAEERYEQAVDLREFGDDDADGALDGLPHFDGEFSR